MHANSHTASQRGSIMDIVYAILGAAITFMLVVVGFAFIFGRQDPDAPVADAGAPAAATAAAAQPVAAEEPEKAAAADAPKTDAAAADAGDSKEEAAGSGETLEYTMGILPGQLKFAKDTFSVKAGQKVKFTLDNNCTLMQMHNWVLCKQGTKDKVIAESNKFMTDPNAMAKGYIPPSGDILHHTKLVQPKQKDTIEFTAPKEKGDYPYICTFPGHALLMFGTMKVE